MSAAPLPEPPRLRAWLDSHPRRFSSPDGRAGIRLRAALADGDGPAAIEAARELAAMLDGTPAQGVADALLMDAQRIELLSCSGAAPAQEPTPTAPPPETPYLARVDHRPRPDARIMWSLRISSEDAQAIHELARRWGTTASEAVRRAVREAAGR